MDSFLAWLKQFFASLFPAREIASTPIPAETKAYSAPGYTYTQWIRYDATFKYFANIYKIDWKWLKAIALNESSLGTNSLVARGAVSTDGKSYGLMQLTFPTAKDMNQGKAVTPDDLNDPEKSINWGAKYISWLYDYCDEELDLAIQAYNCGPGNIKKGIRVPEYLARFKRNIALVEKYQ